MAPSIREREVIARRRRSRARASAQGAPKDSGDYRPADRVLAHRVTCPRTGGSERGQSWVKTAMHTFEGTNALLSPGVKVAAFCASRRPSRGLFAYSLPPSGAVLIFSPREQVAGTAG